MAKSALQVFSIDQAEEWDQIVKSFSLHDTYYLAGYVKAFKLHGDGEPLLFYYDDKRTRGINVVMKRSISDDPNFKDLIDTDRYFDFSTPYGYGGWIIEGEDTKQLSIDYERWCLRNNIVSEFVRFHPVIQNQSDVKEQYDVIPLGNIIVIDCNEPDVIWNNFSSKNRNVIRKAIKNGVVVYHGSFPEIYKSFREIYDKTMENDNASAYYYFEESFYKSIMEELGENAQIFYAVYEEKIIAAAIMLECNKMMNYHLSGSLREYSSLAATNLILYKASLWGSEHGFTSMNLGGGVGSSEDGLLKFKKSFNKEEPKQFYIGRKVFDPDVYQELTMMRGDSITDVNFFPVYRG